MGYILSKYNDTRLEDNSIGVESCRKFVRLFTHKSSSDSNTSLEILHDDLDDLRIAIDVAVDHRQDNPTYRPTAQQLDQWKRDDKDTELLDDLEGFTDDELTRALQVRLYRMTTQKE